MELQLALVLDLQKRYLLTLVLFKIALLMVMQVMQKCYH